MKKINWLEILWISFGIWIIMLCTAFIITSRYESYIMDREFDISIMEQQTEYIKDKIANKKSKEIFDKLKAELIRKLQEEERNKYSETIIPKRQPNITSHNYLENNKIIHRYLSKEKYDITIPNDNKIVLVKFTISKPAAKNRDIFLAINGKTIGRLDRSKQVYPFSGSNFGDNELVYYSNEIPLIGNRGYEYTINLNELSTFSINAMVGETNNYIQEIYLYSL